MTPEQWNKDYEVATVSRLDLEELGVAIQQIDSLTDADMQAIAQHMGNAYCENGYWQDLQFAYQLVLEEREKPHGLS
jgi:heme oxygenase